MKVESSTSTTKSKSSIFMQNANTKVVKHNLDSKEKMNQKITIFLKNFGLINIPGNNL
jgi:hypothetical protein